MVKVVQYSTLPVAGAPWQIYRCLNTYAPAQLAVRYICQTPGYRDGRVFPSDVVFDRDREEAESLIRDADIIHIHQDLPEELTRLITRRTQKVLATLHSIPRMGAWEALMHYAHQTFTIRQPRQMREYPTLQSLPTLFDIWTWKPVPRPLDVLKVAYCPTNRFPVSHLASKGYAEVLQCIATAQRASLRKPLHWEFISFSNKNYLENLAEKSQAHIMIDDVLEQHNTFHLTSLEGASFGQVVLNACKSEGRKTPYPWLYTTLQSLAERLLALLQDRAGLLQGGQQARDWMEKRWNPVYDVEEYLAIYT